MRGWLVAVLIGTVGFSQAPSQRPAPKQPSPSGQRISAADGDLIVADNGARVRFIRRTDANVRAIYNSAEHWLILLVDARTTDGKPPDGGVDTSYTFNDVSGDWPLGERWEGGATVEEYSLVGDNGGMSQGTGLVTPSGLVQLLGRIGSEGFRDPAAAASLTYAGSGRGGGGNQPFAVAEAHQIEMTSRNARNRAQLPGGFSSSMTTSLQAVAPAPPGTYPAPEAPVRVGGNLRTPHKIVDVPAVLPPAAVQANLRGVVIVEIVIGPDGAVRDAKVLRSIPLLDQAAIDAVRQWRYEPTLLNGAPVPVIMTVTVNFQ